MVNTAASVSSITYLFALNSTFLGIIQSIRFSFGKHNTVEEVDYAVEVLKQAVNRLREMSPLFKAEGELKNV